MIKIDNMRTLLELQNTLFVIFNLSNVIPMVILKQPMNFFPISFGNFFFFLAIFFGWGSIQLLKNYKSKKLPIPKRLIITVIVVIVFHITSAFAILWYVNNYII